MKKFLFLSLLCCMSFMSAKAVTVYTTCGIQLHTVSMIFFEDEDDYMEYLRDLNEIHCGVRALPHVED